MYIVNKKWFLNVLGNVVDDSEEAPFYPCENIDDYARFALMVTNPFYEALRKTCLPVYINYRTSFFYLKEFGDPKEKFGYQRLQDLIIGVPSKENYALFLNGFYDVVWRNVFGSFELYLEKNEYKVINDPLKLDTGIYGNYYFGQ